MVAILNPITDLFTGSSEDRVQADQVKENTTTTTTTNTSSDRNTSSSAKQTTPSATTTSTKQPTNTSGSNTRVSYCAFVRNTGDQRRRQLIEFTADAVP